MAKSSRSAERASPQEPAAETSKAPPGWLALFLPGTDETHVRYHFYASGAERSACENHARPFMAIVAREGTAEAQACARCIEAFTFAGKPAPAFPPKAEGQEGEPKPKRPYRADLTDDDVRTMRKDHAEGRASYAQLAERYGLSRDAVRYIVTRRRWKHVV